MTDTEQQLRIRIEELEEEVRQLRVLQFPELTFSCVSGGVIQTSILRMLCGKPDRYVTLDAFSTVGHVNSDSLKVLMCKLRKKLKPHGILIYSTNGLGYMLDAAGAQKLRALADGPVPVAPLLIECPSRVAHASL